MCIFQLRIRMATPTYGGRTTAMYVCVCVCVYNKTQIQMAFYATRFGMHGRRVRGDSG